MTLGQIVYSRSGRDAGRAFIIVKMENDDYVYISDGDMRRFEKAKKKRVKHIRQTDFVDNDIMNRLIEGNNVSNSLIRKTLSCYKCDE